MIQRRLGFLALPLIAAPLLLVMAGPGCRKETASSEERTAPVPNSPALYGEPTGKPSSAVPRVRSHPTNDSVWKTAPFFVLQTELSPATLVHSSTKHLGLFTGMTNTGLSAPTHVAWTTMNGPRSFQRGEALEVTKMDENWILVWWAGAAGWTNWDSPWVVYLQHKPSAMTLDGDG